MKLCDAPTDVCDAFEYLIAKGVLRREDRKLATYRESDDSVHVRGGASFNVAEVVAEMHAAHDRTVADGHYVLTGVVFDSRWDKRMTGDGMIKPGTLVRIRTNGGEGRKQSRHVELGGRYFVNYEVVAVVLQNIEPSKKLEHIVESAFAGPGHEAYDSEYVRAIQILFKRGVIDAEVLGSIRKQLDAEYNAEEAKRSGNALASDDGAS